MSCGQECHQEDLALEKKRLYPLTSWRFFAATLVVFYHCGKVALETSPEWFRCLIQNGYQVVSFFFVLSGFILVYTYHQAGKPSGLKGTPGGFWVARIARIYPTYLLALSFAFPAFVYYGFVKRTLSLPEFFLGLFAVPLLAQAWLPFVAGAWNGPAWAVSVEALFYGCFPRLNGRLRVRPPHFWFWSSLTLLVAVQLCRHYAFPLPESGGRPYEPTLVHNFFAYFPLFHLPTFFFGMALGKVYLSVPARGPMRFQNMVFLLILGILLTLFINHGKIAPIFLSDTVMVPLFGALVFTSANLSGVLNRMLSHPWLVELGEASYGMYILHIPFVWWGTRLRSVIPVFDGKNDIAFFWCYFAVLTLICVLLFEYYEKPLRKWISSRLGEKLFVREKSAKGKPSQITMNPT